MISGPSLIESSTIPGILSAPAYAWHDPLPVPLLLAALNDPAHPLVIFDSLLHVVHATPQFWTQLDISEAVSPGDLDLLGLLSRSALDAPSMESAKEQVLAANQAGKPDNLLILRKREAGGLLQMKLRTLTPGYAAASFTPLAEDDGIEALRANASRDFLTKLANRSCFEQALTQSLSESGGGSAAILVIDLDRFKAVNDTLGHAAGDSLLRLVAERLQGAVRTSDLVARFGGDEFAVLVKPAPTIDVPVAIAERILDLVQRTYLIEGQLVNIGTSIGIALSSEHGGQSSVLVKNADLALYEAKASGRGMFSVFQPTMEARALERRANELELRKALALRQLELFYQPQVDSPAGILTGFEALLRWRHPQRGLLAPASFLPIAEEIGVIVPIGEWVLRTACRQAMKWPAALTIAVNASPLQFDTGTFAQSVKQALKATGLPGERLEIEITEGILLRNNDAVLETLHELRAMKVRIAMDDFGTGYASLSQLAKFPFDKIKIDRSLAGFEGDDKKQRAIVRAITALGQSLGVCTLAEGVENAEQFARLQEDGCSSVQGYLFGRPLPAADAARLVSEYTLASDQTEQQKKL